MKVSTPELLVVLLIVVIIFGPKQLPKLGKIFGKTMKGFKDGISTAGEELEETVTEQPKAKKVVKRVVEVEVDADEDEEI